MDYFCSYHFDKVIRIIPLERAKAKHFLNKLKIYVKKHFPQNQVNDIFIQLQDSFPCFFFYYL